MNVGGIPLAADESGFWVIVCVLATITATAIWLILRRGSDS